MCPRASTQDGSYPRPRLVRNEWESLDGVWSFTLDPIDAGVAERWYLPESRGVFADKITVPFAPESLASGIGDRAFHDTVWYRREVTVTRRQGKRVLLHFGAVDHTARVWVDGTQVGEHAGGQTAFTVDVTDALRDGDNHVVVVRAHDDPHDAELPRGKQDWQARPHSIWYHRSTGIWRTVWLEEVPELHVVDYVADYARLDGALDLTVWLSCSPPSGAAVRASLRHGDELLAKIEVAAQHRRVRGAIEIPAIRNAQARQYLLWCPENPVLLDLELEVVAPDGVVLDHVLGYQGLRTVGAERGAFLLNDRPYFVRSVLEQGYWPTSHLTAPSAGHYREEVEKIKALGFNSVRLHQKVEDPRFHYWADRLGLLVWGEIGAAYEYTPRAAATLMGEWAETVAQYRGHPSIVTWVPLNESWGVQDLALAADQRESPRRVRRLMMLGPAPR